MGSPANLKVVRRMRLANSGGKPASWEVRLWKAWAMSRAERARLSLSQREISE